MKKFTRIAAAGASVALIGSLGVFAASANGAEARKEPSKTVIAPSPAPTATTPPLCREGYDDTYMFADVIRYNNVYHLSSDVRIKLRNCGDKPVRVYGKVMKEGKYPTAATYHVIKPKTQLTLLVDFTAK